METIIAIAIVTMLIGKGAGVVATDIAYAARGKASPRMRLKQEKLKAAAANGGRPVRYGFGGYVADLVDDTWRQARAKREANLANPTPKAKGPLRRYASHLWDDGWDTMGRKHDRKRHARLVKAGLASEDEPTGRDRVGDAFDSTPREAQPPPGHPHAEGDFRPNSSDSFNAEDLRRYAVWAKTRLPQERHDDIDAWLRQGAHPGRHSRVTDVHADLRRWLDGSHPDCDARARWHATGQAATRPEGDHDGSAIAPQTTTSKTAQEEQAEDDRAALVRDAAVAGEEIAQRDQREAADAVAARIRAELDSEDARLGKDPDRRRRRADEKYATWGALKDHYQQRHPDDWASQLRDTAQISPTDDVDFINKQIAKRHLRLVSDSTDPSHNTEPKEKIMTATTTGELTGLEEAIEWATATSTDAKQMVGIVEEAENSLRDGGVRGETLSLMSEISEAYEQLAELTGKLHTKLVAHQGVTEAYEATPDAGKREFVTT